MPFSVQNRGGVQLALAGFFWGWPIIYFVFLSLGLVAIAGVPAEGSYNFRYIWFALGVAAISFCVAEAIVVRGVFLKRVAWGEALSVLGHYSLLCVFYLLLLYPCAIFSFWLAGGEYITASGANLWPAFLVFFTVPLAIWLPLSGRALWKMLKTSSGIAA